MTGLNISIFLNSLMILMWSCDLRTPALKAVKFNLSSDY